jgi:hypothetical protein
VIHSLSSSVAKTSVASVDKLTLSVLSAIDPLNVTQSDVRIATHSGLCGVSSTYVTNGSGCSEFYSIAPVIPTATNASVS